MIKNKKKTEKDLLSNLYMYWHNLLKDIKF
jgi:hypothetical protein